MTSKSEPDGPGLGDDAFSAARRAGCDIGRLILLNGPPGIGKSTCAQLWAASRAAAVVVEIDELRTSIDGWQRSDHSRSEARQMAIEQIDRNLRTGADVMVPQYLGRLDFIETLRQAAETARAQFIEIRLMADAPQVVKRFEARRAKGLAHPEQDVQDVAAEVSDAIARIGLLSAGSTNVVTITADGSPDATVAQIVAILDP